MVLWLGWYFLWVVWLSNKRLWDESLAVEELRGVHTCSITDIPFFEWWDGYPRCEELYRPLHQKKLEKKASVTVPTPWKINMEHNHGGLEDHFPFQIGDF